MSDQQQSNAPAEPTGQQAQDSQPQVPGADRRPGETTAEAARRWKLQVEGREEEVDDAGLLAALIEAHGEDGVRNIGQLSKATRRKMGELTHREKELREAAEDLKDPRRALALFTKLHGPRARAAFEEWYADQLEEQQLSPDQRELRQLRSEREQWQREKRAREEAENAERTKAETQRAQQTIGRQFSQALSEVGLDPTPHVMARMAALAEAELADVGSFDPRELAREVVKEYEGGEVAGLLRKLAKNPAKLVEMLGEDGVRALRQHDVQRVTQKQQPAPVRAAAPQQSSAKPERKRMSIDEWERELERRRG